VLRAAPCQAQGLVGSVGSPGARAAHHAVQALEQVRSQSLQEEEPLYTPVGSLVAINSGQDVVNSKPRICF